MHNEVLADLARDALREFFKQKTALEGFALAGGTGLALGYLGHRTSVDLDLFTHEEKHFKNGPAAIEKAAESCQSIATRQRASPEYAEYLLRRGSELLKIDVVWEPVPPLRPPEQFEGVRIESFLDLAVNKVCALYSRGGRGGEPKDYADLYCILTMGGVTLDELLVHVPNKLVDFNPIYFASFLREAREFEYSGWRWVKRVRDQDIKDRLVAEADRIFARYRPPDQ